MKIEIRTGVESHHTNDNYSCMVVQFDNSDSNFSLLKRNWMPRFDELKRIIETMVDVDPEFLHYLVSFLEERGYRLRENHLGKYAK